MNLSEDNDAFVGESPDVSIPVVVSLIDRQTEALAEIREAHTVYRGWLGSGFETQAAEGFITRVATILDRLGAGAS